MLKVGVVGVGTISKSHIRAWEAMEDVELVALCDIRPEQLEGYTGKHLYTDYDVMLSQETLDIVDVCLPTFLHVENVLKAIEKGINLLCEKPLSMNKDDVKKVYDAAEKHHVKVMVAHVIRFWPEYVLLKGICENGKYGKLLSGNMTRLSSMPKRSWNHWMRDEKLSGLVPYDLHIHDCDFLIHAFGAPQNVVTHRVKRQNQDYLNVMYEYPEFFITTEASWYSAGYPFSAGYRFQFEHATLEYKDGKCLAYEDNGNIVDLSEDSGKDVHSFVPESDGYANEIRYFADCVANDKSVEMVKPDELETVISLVGAM